MDNNNLGVPAYTAEDANESEPVRMGANGGSRRWLTVAEAQLYLHERGHDLSKQNIRKHCRNDRFDEVRQEPTQNGTRHEITTASLDSFLADLQREGAIQMPLNTFAPERTGANAFERVRMDSPGFASENLRSNDANVVRTDANESESVRTSSVNKLGTEPGGGERTTANPDATETKLQAEIEELKQKLFEAEIEKRAAFQSLDWIKDEYNKVLDISLDGQEKIGELRAKVFALTASETSDHRNGDNSEPKTPIYDVQ